MLADSFDKKDGVFQFTPLREGRRCIVHREGSGIVFQFTPLREGRPTISVKNTSGVISIHAPPRGATRRQVLHFSHLLFQFTPLREGRPPTVCISATCTIFQFTPLREGRLLPTLTIPPPRTHFNSRPSARGDCYSFGLSFPSVFQFTPLREGRRPACEICGAARKISIHAPPRGATPPAEHCKKSVLSFQFTPLREGRRRPLKGESAWKNNFNSRPSARGDRCGGGGERNDFDFNSRPSARGDKYSFGHISQRNISIHAPPRGATDVMCLQSAIERISIHAPPRGATIAAEATTVRPYYFNSRPSARGDEKKIFAKKTL